jgi:hypothetical protein
LEAAGERVRLMAGMRLIPPLLDETNAAFIRGGVSINVSSRTDANIPVMARAIGCRVARDRRTVTLLFWTPSAAEFFEGIRVCKQIAAVFSLPSTNQTIQLKSSDALIIPAEKRDIKVAERYCGGMVADVCSLGYNESLVRTLLWFDPHEITAVRFTPSEAFLQTPGPRSGEPLKSGGHAHPG